MDKDYVCGDYGSVTDWAQIRVTVPTERLDELVAVMSMISTDLMIEDYSDIDLKTCYGDLIDETILNADKTHASCSLYLPADSPALPENISFLKDRMRESGIDGRLETVGVKEEDWANTWKKYYKPIKVGKKIVIVPAWEKYEGTPDEILIYMDPGMAFGTGTHETTRLVIRLLEKYTKPGCRMLDVGTGSGILAICASKLGAALCRAYDIDPMSVRVTRENIAAMDIHNITCDQSDLLKQVDTSDGGYDLICANIVADIIIRMAPDVKAMMNPNAVLLVSGIISERREDVAECLIANGLSIIEKEEENGWCAMAVARAEDVGKV